jgi:hypothetical protein
MSETLWFIYQFPNLKIYFQSWGEVKMYIASSIHLEEQSIKFHSLFSIPQMISNLGDESNGSLTHLFREEPVIIIATVIF